MRGLTIILVLFVFTVSLAPRGSAQDKKKPEKKGKPKVIVVLPLGMKPGTTEKLTIRGLNLEGAKEVRFPEGVAVVKITSQGKAGVPDKNPEKVGDTQIVVEVKLKDTVKDNIDFVIVYPDGETKPHTLLIETAWPLVKDKEPNEGFRNAQQINQTPVVIEGTIERPRDVDVIQFAGKKGQTFVAEVLAARHGSALDPQLVLYRSGSIQVDGKITTMKGDPRLEVVLPADDQYFLSLTDTLDMGGQLHVYRLKIEVK